MKKTYVKPQVYFEDFQLSASIAATCDKEKVNHAMYTCGVQSTAGIIFLSNVTQCVGPGGMVVEEEAAYPYCYQAVTDGLFAS